MFSETAAYYDLIYASFKDYARETTDLVKALRREHPACRSVLDVACGTGEHARRLAEHGFVVDGIDLDPAFVGIARAKHPQGRFVAADMCDVHLDHRYDAVICLFSSIGYARTLDRVESAFRCFREHLAPGGVIFVEPWFPPGFLEHGRVMSHDAAADGVHVTRVSRTEVDGRLSRLYFDYEITEHGTTRRASEVHELGLFTVEEMADAFTRAGLDATFDPHGFCDRGLFVARSRPEA